jgi:hypothetical protein
MRRWGRSRAAERPELHPEHEQEVAQLEAQTEQLLNQMAAIDPRKAQEVRRATESLQATGDRDPWIEARRRLWQGQQDAQERAS